MTSGEYIEVRSEQCSTLQARDWKDPQRICASGMGPDYIVRKLTPTECAVLQGFPRAWCQGLGVQNPTAADISRWAEVFETWRLAMGGKKPKTRAQIERWLRDPYSDAAEYKLWGNGVALPCVRFVLRGIVWAHERCPAMCGAAGPRV